MLTRWHQVGIRKLNDLNWVCRGEELDTIEGQVEQKWIMHRELECEEGSKLVVEVEGLGWVRQGGWGGGLPGGKDKEVARLLRLFLVED